MLALRQTTARIYLKEGFGRVRRTEFKSDRIPTIEALR